MKLDMQDKHLYEYAVIRIVPKIERDDSKEDLLAFLMNPKTLISIYSIDRYIENSTFALWFFHNSIRFKVNKVG